MQGSNEGGGSVVNDRADLPRGFLNTFWPLAALGLLLLALLRACAPSPAPVAPPPTQVAALFDAAGASRQANDAALDALRALSEDATLEDLLAALNGLVINFATGSAAVPVDADEPLRVAARMLASLPPGTRILIIGHTDNVGDTAANLVLSRRRAQSVRAALIAHGAPAAALLAHGLGDSRPVADNSDEAGRFRNRRIEFSAAP